MKTNMTLLPIDSVPVFAPTWEDIQGKAHFYKTARRRSTGEYVAIKGVRDDRFIIQLHDGRCLVESTADLCAFCL